MHLSHKRGHTKAGKCNVPCTRFEPFSPAIRTGLGLIFGVDALGSLKGVPEELDWL